MHKIRNKLIIFITQMKINVKYVISEVQSVCNIDLDFMLGTQRVNQTQKVS